MITQKKEKHIIEYFSLRNGKKVVKGTFRHPFFIPANSVWPFSVAWTLAGVAGLSVSLMHGGKAVPGKVNDFIFFTYEQHGMPVDCIAGPCFLAFILCFIGWTKELKYEVKLGYNTNCVQQNLRLGWSLFILSEIMFFFALFWAFFHSSLSPAMEIGFVWPPLGIICFDPMEIPLVNTIILLSSGAFATWAHYSLGYATRQLQWGLIISIVLGSMFTIFQVMEYEDAAFSIKDGIYGSLFYLITGFHGFHVVIGTLLLYNCLKLSYKGYMTKRTVLVDLFVWYWHFVDVIWLFVFSFIYCWGSGF